ncbi:MAG: SpoIIE family protein phosphatase [Gammaproteobacteria bacterium]|nr:SpoIIE family protein phosphatase [Gammaproteobacteria bacterium]
MSESPAVHLNHDDQFSLEEHLDLLAEISEAFATSLNLDDTLQHALNRIMEYLDAEAASIFLLDEGDTKLNCRACAGPIDIKGLRVDVGQGVVGRTLQENRVIMVRDVDQDPSFTNTIDKQTGFKTRSVLCAPLKLRDRRIGTLELINKRSVDALFDSRDQRLLETLAASASMVIHNATLAASLVEHERIQRELELAAEIQRNLLPHDSTALFPVHGINIPAREVSGDFYDYFTLPDGRIMFNLADVSGKGMNAALLMAKTSSLFHCLGKSLTSPGQLLGILNNEIHEKTTRGMFVTMVGGVFNPDDQSLCFANAGHQPPLLVDQQGQFREIEVQAPPLGIEAHTVFPETHLILGGGSLYIYSDGLTEACGANGKQLGVSGIKTMIKGVAHLSAAQRIKDLVKQVMDGTESLHDDMTLMVIEAT